MGLPRIVALWFTAGGDQGAPDRNLMHWKAHRKAPQINHNVVGLPRIVDLWFTAGGEQGAPDRTLMRWKAHRKAPPDHIIMSRAYQELSLCGLQLVESKAPQIAP